jgi:hypothetical protein
MQAPTGTSQAHPNPIVLEFRAFRVNRPGSGDYRGATKRGLL